MELKRILRPLAMIAIAASATVTAHADPITFAQFTEQTGGQDFTLTNSGGTEELKGTTQIYFLFQNVSGVPSGPQSATLTFDLTSTNGDTVSGSNISESGFSGTFTITLNNPQNGMSNLLSGTVLDSPGATLTGKIGGNSGGVGDSTPPPTEVQFSSDFLNFQNTTSQAFAISLSSVVPAFQDDHGHIQAFTSAGSGTFSYTSTPEPGSILTLGAGLIAVGAYGRRRLKRRS